MRKIVVFGAGKSTSYLLDYLSRHAAEQSWEVTVADLQTTSARQFLGDEAGVNWVDMNVMEEAEQRQSMVSEADVVISMLPARFHGRIALDCVTGKTHLVTASYLDDQIRTLHSSAQNAGLTFLNEIGLDPGLDHLSAVKEINDIKQAGGKLTTFESFTGGLVAPESDDNPWRYKFTWNPRNVVLAGQGNPVKFIQEGRYKYIPYQKVFRRTEIIEVPGYGNFEGYANRDSLKYREVYGLDSIPTLYRGTLRRPGFCKAWDVFVQLGATDDSYVIEDSGSMTHRSFINSFLAYNPSDSVELKLMHYLHIDQDSEIMQKLTWLGIFEETPIELDSATPAQILQHILEKKWGLSPDDKDMIVMWHKFIYEQEGQEIHKTASTVVEGEDAQRTAMAKTVGLPLAVATKLLLNGGITEKGALLPISPTIYEPVLAELETLGITFKTQTAPAN